MYVNSGEFHGRVLYGEFKGVHIGGIETGDSMGYCGNEESTTNIDDVPTKTSIHMGFPWTGKYMIVDMNWGSGENHVRHQLGIENKS